MFTDTYSYSQLSSESVGQLVQSHYDFPGQLYCRFYVLGLHDNYLIGYADKKYILRIYRRDWRSFEDVLFELELLAYLGNKGAAVAAPIPTKSGDLSVSVNSPEGSRYATLFNYAEGIAPGKELNFEQSALLGESVAKIHLLSDRFKTKHKRQELDIPFLLDGSITVIQPFIDADARSFLNDLKGFIKDGLPPLSVKNGQYGIVIGDVNSNNFHINDNKKITVFDFDQCGYAHRAFEIAKFVSSIQSSGDKPRLVDAFVDSYHQMRNLSEAEVLAIPYYELISIIWVMAIHVHNVERIGYKYLEKPFWDHRMKVLRRLVMALS